METDLFKNYHIILASGSPRRQEFMRELGIPFEVRLKPIEELYPDSLSSQSITEYLSELKAEAFSNDLKTNEILITSDTLVWHESKALGKPKNTNEAFEMLYALSGKTHEVITSVTLKSISKSKTFTEITKVTFDDLKPETIRFYIENYKPFDKAGAYGIQEWIGLIGITKIEGSYTNVVGMPMQRVYSELINFIS
ncbi:Maf-like protein [Flavobacterium sp.]|uniref:Maf-like protein n=1 Tax=Flavobacterium sp. TaxID=239 RepID=UPI002FDB5A31